MLFVYYPKCGTCKKAQAFLTREGVKREERDIAQNPPTEAELRQWQALSGVPVKKLFNTSGKLYRELELSKKLPQMSEDEQFALLASDGMLVKRPVFVLDKNVLVGFKEEEWRTALGIQA